MKKEKESKFLQKIAIGTNKLLLAFYDEASKENSIELFEMIKNGDYEFYTTTLNIAELHHIIFEKEYELYLGKNQLTRKEISFEKFSQLEGDRVEEKFKSIYERIKDCIKIEKYFLGENFENEYAKEFSNNTIFSSALSMYCKENNVKNII